MPLELRQADGEDAPRAAQLEAAAYAPNPFNRILFPGPFPPEALDGRAQQMLHGLKTDARIKWLKIIDTDLPEGPEQMIAFAEWHIYHEKPQPTQPRTFGPGCNKETCEMLFGGIAKQRQRIMGDKPYFYLRFLHTEPKHQGRGAGGMLTEWGVQEARKQRMIAYLESSEAGHSLYKKCGFRDVECLSLDLSKWGATENHNTWSMICDPLEFN
ncbi:acyl-CoA N-acyltransferase [Hypoxylon fuscum]|nr:acyl-CoA N-acyltransferase [Hypoxylon fuscum]